MIPLDLEKQVLEARIKMAYWDRKTILGKLLAAFRYSLSGGERPSPTQNQRNLVRLYIERIANKACEEYDALNTVKETGYEDEE